MPAIPGRDKPCRIRELSEDRDAAIMPGVDNPNNDAGEEVLEDEADDGVEKSPISER